MPAKVSPANSELADKKALWISLDDGLAAPKTSGAWDAAQVAHAVALLGYPISRVAVCQGLPDKLMRVFVRARQSYYQNRQEFESLQVLLEAQLRELDASLLQELAAQAEPFVPMWMGAHQGETVLQDLR